MRKNTTFPPDIERKLTAYRKLREGETGKKLFRETAIRELLQQALDGFEPAKPLQERLDELERRLSRLESELDKLSFQHRVSPR